MFQTALPATDSNLKDTFIQGEKEFPLQYYVDELEKYPGQKIALHWHPELEFYVANGCSVKVQVDSGIIMLQEGEGIFVNSNVLHAYYSAQTGCSTHPNIVFSSELLAPFNSIIQRKYVTTISNNTEIPYILLKKEIGWQLKCLELLDELFSLLQKYSKASAHYGQFPLLPFQNASITSTCYELDVHILLRQTWKIFYENIDDIPRIVHKKGNQSLQIRMQKMISFIYNSYSHAISLKEIADSAGVSKSEAARCFDTYMKTSPMRFLQEYRLKTAQNLLRQTTMTVAEISEACGFESSSYFCKIFKAQFQMTPLQYRTFRALLCSEMP